MTNSQKVGARIIIRDFEKKIERELVELKKEALKFKIKTPNRNRLDGWVESHKEVLSRLEMFKHNIKYQDE